MASLAKGFPELSPIPFSPFKDTKLNFRFSQKWANNYFGQNTQ